MSDGGGCQLQACLGGVALTSPRLACRWSPCWHRRLLAEGSGADCLFFFGPEADTSAGARAGAAHGWRRSQTLGSTAQTLGGTDGARGMRRRSKSLSDGVPAADPATAANKRGLKAYGLVGSRSVGGAWRARALAPRQTCSRW